MLNESYPLPVALQRAAIDGHPVATNPAQAAELIAAENREAANAARRVAGLIECRECGKIGQQGRMSSGHPIPICVACKAEADRALLARCKAAALPPFEPQTCIVCDGKTSGMRDEVRPLCDECRADERCESPREKRAARRHENDIQEWKERGL